MGKRERTDTWTGTQIQRQPVSGKGRRVEGGEAGKEKWSQISEGASVP